VKISRFPSLTPQAIAHILLPVNWPARRALRLMIALLAAEAIVLMPMVLGLSLWLYAYSVTMYPYWRRVHLIQSVAKRYNENLPIAAAEHSMVWRARRWFGIGLLLTILQAPQIVTFLIELPWLNSTARRLYEVEPLDAPHRWHWCGVNPVWGLDVRPSGAYLILGVRRVAYCSEQPTDGRGGIWHHLVARWWYFETMEMGYSPPWELNR